LFLAKSTQTTLLDICHVDQPDEVHPFLIEAVPSSPCRIFSEPFPVERTPIIDIVLTRYIKHLLSFAIFKELVEHIELCGIRKMR
jgi:hypothetical protein